MATFFLLLEISMFLYMGYFLFQKQELAVIHLPVWLFAQAVITPVFPAFINYILISSFVLYLIYKNLNFFSHNIFAILLTVLFLLLATKSTDFVFLRPFLFSVIWLFLLIPLIDSIYRKYPGRILFRELSLSALVILIIFIVNVMLSSVAGYAPHAMYGITSGILYGNLYATDFNILAIALFIVLLQVLNKKNLLHFVVFMLSLGFLMLSLRRSVMGLCLFGIAIALFIFLTAENFKTMASFSVFFVIIGGVIILNTNFLDLFNERYALRGLDNRALDEEKRFLEYELLYNDLFVYQDYSPWLGYGLYDSGGNYGKGVLGTRTLHADLTSIVHSSGFVGLALYLLMMFTAFSQSFGKAKSRADYFIILFCATVFLVYTITGRFSNIGSYVFLILLLMLPISVKMPIRKRRVSTDPKPKEHPHMLHQFE